MVRQCTPREILGLLCRYAGQPDERNQIAVFVIEGRNWALAAKGALSRRSEAALARMDPARVSNALLHYGLKTGEHPVHRFDGGWARPLYSGPGELLGMIAGFRDGPPLPSGPDSVRMELILRLATLAIEQANLIGELAFAPGRNVVPDRSDLAWDSEASVQQVTQMIAQQRAPEEILAVLCTHAGGSDEEHQVAFFLTRDGMWTLAAKGPLTPQSEGALALIDPERLSTEIFESDADATDRSVFPFQGGWARHLCSGTGELLGLMVCPCGSPALPRGTHAARIESACRLAALAVEQTNLIGELAFKADHDSLTGLPNRDCHERLVRSMLRENSRTGTSAALLYLNLDRFRLINEVFGLATGNRLLQEVGRRLQACLGSGPRLARMGGDEFAVLVPGITAPEDAGAVTARLLD